MKEIIEKAKKWALEEKKGHEGTGERSQLAVSKGQELAERLKADKDIVMLGTLLMDIKLVECIREGKVKEHIDRSTKATKEFLDKFDIDKTKKDKIINCVEAHHGTKEFICKEAEICANADCYKFLHPRGVLASIKTWSKRYDDFSKILDMVEMKLEEKHNILTLDICKKELEPYYQTFKKLFRKAKSEL